MANGIRSMATFIYGSILVAVGVTVALTDGTGLEFGPTASVAALTVAVVVLLAALLSSRAKANPAGRVDPPEVKTESDQEADLDLWSDLGLGQDLEPDLVAESDPEESGESEAPSESLPEPEPRK